MNPENIKLGDIITVEVGLKLCKHFNLNYLVKRIESNPERYRSFEFDGCSCVPDRMMFFLTRKRWQDITYKCCLPHDLAYAYGAPDDESERAAVDSVFHSNLIMLSGMYGWVAKLFYLAVRLGGGNKDLSFSWVFANK